MPNNYIAQVNALIEFVVQNVAANTIPGAGYFLNIFAPLIKARGPREYDEAMIKIDAIEKTLNNTFSVVVGAIYYATLRENFLTVDGSVKEIFRLFRDKNGDYVKDAYGIALSLATLDGPVAHQIGIGDLTLGAFESATADHAGTLLSYVGKYLHVISLVQQAVSNAQSAINMVLDALDKQELTDPDKQQERDGKIKKLADANIALLNEANTFVTTSIPAHYPKWSKHLFSRELIVFRNKENPSYVIGCEDWQREDTLTAINSGYGPQYAYVTVYLQCNDDGSNARWHIEQGADQKQWFTQSGSSSIYWRSHNNKGEKNYDFPLYYDYETFIIRAPFSPGDGGESFGVKTGKHNAHSFGLMPTKAHDPAIQWIDLP